MLIGIIVGVIWAVSLLIAYMVGYGMADMKNKQNKEQE